MKFTIYGTNFLRQQVYRYLFYLVIQVFIVIIVYAKYTYPPNTQAL